jgi:hypothetical protein
LQYWFFLRLGNTPATGWGIEGNFSVLLQGAFAAFMGSVFASLSIFGIYGNFYKISAHFNVYANVLIIVILIAITVFVYINRRLLISKLKTDIMLRLTLVTVCMYIVFWIGFVLRKSAVANEDRLFLPSTILVLPYFVHYIFQKNITKYIASAIIVLSVSYGAITYIYRIKTYSKNRSAFSCNPQLNGFKLFVPDTKSVADMNNISHLITNKFNDTYVLTPHADIVFLLNNNNKFIITPVPHIVSNSIKKANYLLLLRNDSSNNNTVSWHIVYSTNTYSLYQLN